MIYKYKGFLYFHVISDVHFSITPFFKLTICLTCSLKDSQKFFLKSLPLYTMLTFYDNTDNIDNLRDTHVDIIVDVDIKKTDRICSPTLAVDDIPGLFSHSSIFSTKDSRSKSRSWCFVRFRELNRL